jgi:hypothetical protein
LEESCGGLGELHWEYEKIKNLLHNKNKKAPEKN